MNNQLEDLSNGTVRRAFVLLSGGLDSTTCLYQAIKDYGDVEAVSVDYGQRHKKEMDYAKKTCDKLRIPFTIIPLGNALSDKNTMLSQEGADSGVNVPDISYGEIKGVSPTYVPFRNGTMLSLITAHAQKWVNETLHQRALIEGEGGYVNVDPDIAGVHAGVYFGAHSEDAQNWAYPDCTPEFIGAMANAIFVGTYRAVRLHTPIQWMMKHQIVRHGHELNVPFEDTWSCYKGEELHCGTCPTCISRRDAFTYAGVQDPTEYKQSPHHHITA